jgi:hypothetical protein
MKLCIPDDAAERTLAKIWHPEHGSMAKTGALDIPPDRHEVGEVGYGNEACGQLVITDLLTDWR